jgi:hypothetical protein
MSPLPLPIRLAAGLAAVAMERARKLPQDVSEWPMTAVSQALQVSMRVQQRITELAIKGDEALAGLREVEEDPPWAVFDEDLPSPTGYRRPEFDDEVAGYDFANADATAEEQSWFEAIDEVYGQPAEPEAADATRPTEPTEPTAESVETPDTVAPTDGHAERGPGVLPSYPELSLASVRGRLRAFTVDDLEELLDYERNHGDRADFVRMLTNRIATVRNR